MQDWETRSIVDARIGVIGLGYVGLPLAVEFGKQYDTVGYDIDAMRIEGLHQGGDRNREVSQEDLAAAKHLRLTTSLEDLRDRNVYIVTVPTPINEHKHPDFTPPIQDRRTNSNVLMRRDGGAYEYSVNRGAAEENGVAGVGRGGGRGARSGWGGRGGRGRSGARGGLAVGGRSGGGRR